MVQFLGSTSPPGSPNQPASPLEIGLLPELYPTITTIKFSYAAAVCAPHRASDSEGADPEAGPHCEATIIQAPSSTQNQERQQDPERTSTKKGNTWPFGLKAHVGTDTPEDGHSVADTTHDSTLMEAGLHGEEERIYGDKAYVSAER